MRACQRLIGALLLLLTLSAGPAFACGAQSDCVVGDRSYRIMLPDGYDGSAPLPAILHAHGYKGSAAGALRNKGLRAAANAAGAALIAADSKGDDWALPHSPSVMRGSQADLAGELRYFEAVLADAAARFNIDRAQVMATGFSAGGMMVWTLACHRADLFAGFAPISGTFWAPVPDDCPSAPVHLLHTHGRSDKVVPMEGRRIGPAKQGDVTRALRMYRKTGGFADQQSFASDDGMACQRWTNPTGKVMELCLHPGGHAMKGAFVRRAWQRLKQLGALGATD